MKKMFFFSIIDFTNWQANGICKKVLNQVEAFRNAGYVVDFCYTKKENIYINNGSGEKIIGNKKGLIIRKCICNSIITYISQRKYDAVYVRYCFAEKTFIDLIKKFKERSRTVIVEIPTYPYDEEFKNSLINRVFLFLDKMYRYKMKLYVDKIITFTNDQEIFGIPTIQTKNGVDFTKIKPVFDKKCDDKSINIIAVADLEKWHGYDRVLEGLGEYYYYGGNRDIILHLVGDGSELDFYKSIVEKWKINKNVIFYGKKYGLELDSIYGHCDIALDCFGLHRKGVSLSSSLKSREYSAKGLPIAASNDIDIFLDQGKEFFLKFPENETPINIKTLIDFYDKIYQNKSKKEVVTEIREFALNVCDINAVIKPILDYFDSNAG